MADPSLEAKMRDVQARLAKERKFLEGFRTMKAATRNVDVQKSCDAKIEQAVKTIGYFEESLRELSQRQASPLGSSASLSNLGGSGGAAGASGMDPRANAAGGRSGDPRLSASSATGGPSYSNRALPLPPGQQPRPDSGLSMNSGGSSLAPQRKAQYTNLDLVKADTPLTPAKISRMLHLLQFKLTLENQFRDGIEKMIKLYTADGDRRSRSEAESKRVESQQKIMLLSSALKRYKALDVMGDDIDDDETEDVMNNSRRPQTGALSISIGEATGLDRPPTAKRGRTKPESVVVIKVEGTPRARTHPSRTDKWAEDFEIHVDKASEIEISVYDKSTGEVPIPIGLLWLRLSDIAEELRRRKTGQDTGAPGWVTASRMEGGASGSGSSLASMTGSSSSSAAAMDVPFGQQLQAHGQPAAPIITASGSEGIDAWFAVEPEGRIHLHLNFAKSNLRKRPIDGAVGLGRQGAVRKRKNEVHEQNGHKFVLKQFYAVVLCAYCRQFFRDGSGMQCEDCKYACHQKCYGSVVTKCVSKSVLDMDKDEEKINHRIPHRFEPPSGLTPNWCCHCGLVIGLGKKKARKCSECGLAAHVDCVHLVPDFCGMSMEMANQLLREVKQINTVKARFSAAPPMSIAPVAPPQQDRIEYGQPSAGVHGEEPVEQLGRMRIDERPPPPPPSQPGYPSARPDDSYARPPRDGPPPPSRADYARDQRYPAQPSLPPLQQQPPPSQQQQQQAGRLPSYPPGSRPMPPAPTQQFDAYGRPIPAPPLQQPQPPRQPPPQQQPYPSMQPPLQSRPPPPQQQSSSQLAPLESPPRRSSMHSQQQPARQSQQVASPPSAGPPAKRRRVGLDDFNFLAVLGKGNFGKVMLAEEKRSQRLYAIKVLKKDFIIENDEVDSTKSEKRVFLAAARENHPFLLGLHSCFQTETRIYLCMEYVSGGDLMLHIQREQFTPRRARFYAAEVLLALEFLHRCGIIYRDLKLDNILLTLDGHIKVADYGLCKEGMHYGATTATFCGTPEFMAPEILLEQRYGRAVDWWAFGVLIYEMLLGQSPFKGDDEEEIFDAILEDEPLYPIHMPKKSVSILQKLLTRDPTRRLGAGPDDAEEIRRHPFFEDVNWDDMLNKRVPPPFLPTIKSATDNFESSFTSEEPRLTPVHTTLTEAQQEEFRSFSWSSPFALAS